MAPWFPLPGLFGITVTQAYPPTPGSADFIGPGWMRGWPAGDSAATPRHGGIMSVVRRLPALEFAMTPESFQFATTVFALTGAAAAVAWVVLLLQGWFADRRIALVAILGTLVATFVSVFAEDAGRSVALAAAAIAAALFLFWLGSHLRKASVWIPAVVFAVSAAAAVWAYRTLAAAV